MLHIEHCCCLAFLSKFPFLAMTSHIAYVIYALSRSSQHQGLCNITFPLTSSSFSLEHLRLSYVPLLPLILSILPSHSDSNHATDVIVWANHPQEIQLLAIVGIERPGIISVKQDPHQLVTLLIGDQKLHFNPHRVIWMQGPCIQSSTNDAKGTIGKCGMYEGVQGHGWPTQGCQTQTLGTMCLPWAMDFLLTLRMMHIKQSLLKQRSTKRLYNFVIIASKFHSMDVQDQSSVPSPLPHIQSFTDEH